MSRNLRLVTRLAPTAGLLALMALIISGGFSAGFDHRIPENEWGRFVFALAAALSAKVYGLAGCVTFEPVEAALKAGGLTSEPSTLAEIGTTFPENFHDPRLIDAAIAKASKVDIAIPSPPLQNEQFHVRPAPGEDLGLVALAVLAFTLFSPSVKAIYLTYLMVFGASIALFWCAFRDRPHYVGLLLLLCAVMYALLSSPLFPGDETLSGKGAAWTTPLSGHFLSTLVLVPTLHVLAISCRRPRPSLVQALCLGAQAVILYIAFRIRLSSMWVLFPMGCGLLLALVRPLEKPQPAGADAADAHGATAAPVASAGEWSSRITRVISGSPAWARKVWPALLVLLVLVTANVAFRSWLHPLYQSGKNLTRHTNWFEIYYGLQSHQDWRVKYGPTHRVNGEIATGDDVPMSAVLLYLDAHREIDRTTLFGPAGNLYWGAIEHYSMLALWDFVRADPRFVMQVFQYKLAALALLLPATTRWVIGSLSIPGLLLLLLVAGCATYAVAAVPQRERRSFGWCVVLVWICVPASWLPNLASIVGWEVMADAIASWLFALLVLSVCLAAALWAGSSAWAMHAMPAWRSHRRISES